MFFVGFGIIVTDEEDGAVSKCPNHQEASNVLVMGVQRCHGGVVLSHEGVGRHSIHVLCHYGSNHTEGGESQTQLEVQRVVDGVVETFVTFTQHAAEGSAFGGIVGTEDLFDAVTDTKVGTVHVTGDDEQDGDRQVVMRHVRQPQGLSLRVEPTQEGQDSGSCTFRCAKDMASGVRTLSIHAPVTGEERLQSGGVRHGAEEVIPAHMLTARFRDGDMHQVTRPSQ